MAISGCVFLFWLGLLVAMGSETMYIKYHSKLETLISLWLPSLVL